MVVAPRPDADEPTVWAGTAGGLAFYDPPRWRVFPNPEGFPEACRYGGEELTLLLPGCDLGSRAGRSPTTYDARSVSWCLRSVP